MNTLLFIQIVEKIENEAVGCNMAEWYQLPLESAQSISVMNPQLNKFSFVTTAEQLLKADEVKMCIAAIGLSIAQPDLKVVGNEYGNKTVLMSPYSLSNVASEVFGMNAEEFHRLTSFAYWSLAWQSRYQFNPRQTMAEICRLIIMRNSVDFLKFIEPAIASLIVDMKIHFNMYHD